MIWKRYSIQSGDTLLKLAHRFNTTVEVLRNTNSISGNLIRQGEKIIIPIASKGVEAYTLSAGQRNIKLQKRKQKADKSNKITHQIQSGDSLWSIAKRYNVTTKELASWNNINSKSVLQVNNTLDIWPKVNTSQTPSERSNVLKKVNYKVRQDDNLSMIAWRFNVKLADIHIWNKSLKKYLQPGQLLTLYVDVTKTRQ
jgi:membrane-bound lytic murein transglycosylase D